MSGLALQCVSCRMLYLSLKLWRIMKIKWTGQVECLILRRECKFLDLTRLHLWSSPIQLPFPLFLQHHWKQFMVEEGGLGREVAGEDIWWGSECTNQPRILLYVLMVFGLLQYDNFIKLFTRILEHPYSYREEKFIMAQRKPLPTESVLKTVPEVT